MHHRSGGNRSSSRKNLIYGIVIVILAVLVGVLLWMNKVEEEKSLQSFRHLARNFFRKNKKSRWH